MCRKSWTDHCFYITFSLFFIIFSPYYLVESLKSCATHCITNEVYDCMTARDDDKTFCIFSPDNLPLKCKIYQHLLFKSSDSKNPRKVIGQTPLVLTSSGCHCSSRYASYWNTLLLLISNFFRDMERQPIYNSDTGIGILTWIRFLEATSQLYGNNKLCSATAKDCTVV